MHGTQPRRIYEMAEADMICAIGARFATGAPGRDRSSAAGEVIQTRYQTPARISKNVPAQIPSWGREEPSFRRLPASTIAKKEPGRNRGVVVTDTIRGGRRPPRADTTERRTRRSTSKCGEALYLRATGGGKRIVTRDVGAKSRGTAQVLPLSKPRRDQLGRPRDDGLGYRAAMEQRWGCPDQDRDQASAGAAQCR